MNYRVLFIAVPLAITAVGCQNSLIDRSLIFSTHTTLGIEISASPAETESPVKLVIGYKRSEGVLNPVYYNLQGASTQPVDDQRRTVRDFYLENAYSVLAKFQGLAVGSGGGKAATTMPSASSDGSQEANGVAQASVEGRMTLSQWFATGRAADILAVHGAAAALTDNPAVAAAAAVASNKKSFADQVLALPPGTRHTVFTAVYTSINSLNVPEAIGRLAALNAAGKNIAAGRNVNVPAEYIYNPTNKTLTANPLASLSAPEFPAVVSRLGSIRESISHLQKAKAALADGTLQPVVLGGGLPAAQLSPYVGSATPPTSAQFDVTLNHYEHMEEALRREIATLPELEAATTYLAKQLGLKE